MSVQESTLQMASTKTVDYTFGLLGERVDYSRSPEIFNSIFEADGAVGSFEIINCSVEGLEAKLHELRESGFDALCVTIPHKEAIVPFLDKSDRIADALRSVNSVKFGNGDSSISACGFNTDSYGFAQPLLPYAAELKGKSAIILGAGGAARSVAYSLALDSEVSEITFCSRGVERLNKTQAMLSEIFPRLTINSVEWNPEQKLPADSSVAIAVNATPLGGPNAPLANIDGLFSNLPSSSLFYDLNYNGDGSLKAEAKKYCRLSLDGLPMLIHQALRSYYLWTGRKISYEAVSSRVQGDEC